MLKHLEPVSQPPWLGLSFGESTSRLIQLSVLPWISVGPSHIVTGIYRLVLGQACVNTLGPLQLLLPADVQVAYQGPVQLSPDPDLRSSSLASPLALCSPSSKPQPQAS